MFCPFRITYKHYTITLYQPEFVFCQFGIGFRWGIGLSASLKFRQKKCQKASKSTEIMKKQDFRSKIKQNLKNPHQSGWWFFRPLQSHYKVVLPVLYHLETLRIALYQPKCLFGGMRGATRRQTDPNEASQGPSAAGGDPPARASSESGSEENPPKIQTRWGDDF